MSSPIWSIVDGPWRLSAFSPDGHDTFVPNKAYSGPVKPKLAAFQEVPFASYTAEFYVLQSPRGGRIDVGYLPFNDAPVRPASAAAGPNPLAGRGYSLHPFYTWGINYYVMNFHSTTGNGPVIRQLYFRQAIQPDEPGRGDPGPAAWLWSTHRGPGAQHTGHAVPVLDG